MSSVAGPAVAGAWIIQAASATMRPEPGWIDRAGAFVGCRWLADFLLILIALNMRRPAPTTPPRPSPMRAVLQRVTRASVEVDGRVVGRIGVGWLVLLGVARGDVEADAEKLAEKVAGLRAFEDGRGKMNLAVAEVGGSVLVVSQFTLLGDCRAGRRPSFLEAAEPAEAKRLYLRFADHARGLGLPVETGTFRADMKVELLNDGPVTLLLDSRKAF